ncbi:RNA polymerase sigma factor [Haloferula chungangensis]|uniref:RNA polymerase sigma factor n=1 Tax=Haloferula chungangensis TaxID=1048331 RepID=A0ABW2L573_9BACT
MPDLKEAPSTRDEALLRRFADHRRDADFSEIVRRHLPLVLTITRRRLGNSGLAEDAAQQVFIALSSKSKQVSQLPSLVAWLQKAAVFEASNLARKESRHQKRIEQAADLLQESTASPDLQALDKALASLPQIDRQILVLHHFEKLTFADIARRLNLNEAAAQRRGHRALAKLAKRISAQGKDSDHASCSTLIASAFLPADISLSPALFSRISTLKKSAALPWIPLLIATGFTGTAAVAISAYHKQPPPPPNSTAAPLTREPALRRPFKPQIADDDLSDVLREFIALAKTDSIAAWEFAKQQPQGAADFLKSAVRALADRDLPAADRLLEVIDGDRIRSVVIASIFNSRASGNFESAILWIDALPDPVDRKVIYLSSCAWVNTEHLDHDYAGALNLARHPEVRNWLLTEACEKASDVDETQIETLATTLEGNERRLVLGYFTSLLLQRGDPRAYEWLEVVKPDDTQSFDMLPNIDQIALRDPRPLLEWISAQNDGNDRSYMARNLWHQWGRSDAQAAAAWWHDLTKAQRHQLGLRATSLPTLQRLIDQP